MMETSASTVAPFQLPSFQQQPAVCHGITGKDPTLWRNGDISYKTGGDPEQVLKNRRAWTARIGVNAERLVTIHQVHSSTVVAVDGATWSFCPTPRGLDDVPRADALLTNTPDTPLFLSFADCTPLLFFDPVQRVVGLAHAGWRGTVGDIAGATVRAMLQHYGSRPADILAGIGPAIGPCCYLVDEPVVAAWQALGIAAPEVLVEVAPVAGRRQWRFALAQANRCLLERAGVPTSQIDDAALCTSCNVAAFPSHRAEQGQAGRFAAIIALTTE